MPEVIDIHVHGTRDWIGVSTRVYNSTSSHIVLLGQDAAMPRVRRLKSQSSLKAEFVTFLWHFSRVAFQMGPQIACLSRIGWICEFFFLQNPPQIVFLNRCRVTLFAFEQFVTWWSFQTIPQIACPNRCKVGLVAFVHLFSWVSFQMCPQIACLYTCIGYIFKCVLKLAACMYTLVTFEQFFPWGSFQMFSQIACPNRCRVELIAFLGLFTWGSFRHFLKSPAWIDAKSHLYAFSQDWLDFKLTLEKKGTNATNATVHLFRHTIWGDN